MKVFRALPDLDHGKEILDKFNYQESDVELKDLGIHVRLDDRDRISLALEIGNEILPLSKQARKNLKELTGVSKGHFKEYADSPRLTREMITHCLRKRDNETLKVSSLRENEIMGIYGEDQPEVSPITGYDILRDEINALQKIDSIKYIDGVFQFRFVAGESEEPPARSGDISHVGLYAQFNGSAEVHPYTYRLVCTNGMMGYRVEEEYENQAFEERARRAIQKSRELLKETINAVEIEVEDPALHINHLARHNNLGKRQRNRLLDQLPALREDATGYDLIQFVTEQEHVFEDESFQEVGFEVLRSFREENQCSRCGSTI